MIGTAYNGARGYFGQIVHSFRARHTMSQVRNVELKLARMDRQLDGLTEPKRTNMAYSPQRVGERRGLLGERASLVHRYRELTGIDLDEDEPSQVNGQR